MASTSKPGYLWGRTFLYWLPTAFCLTVIAGMVYGTVQQNFRQNANDPQIQMAEDAAALLQAGQSPQTVVGTSAKVDMANSLAPYLIVYDEAGQPVASSVQLNGQTPDLPAGVFTSVRQSGEDRLSWQPQPGVRSAAVVTHFGGNIAGFVLAGRSLREVEDREAQLTQLVFLAWIVGIVGSFVIWLFVIWLTGRMPAR